MLFPGLPATFEFMNNYFLAFIILFFVTAGNAQPVAKPKASLNHTAIYVVDLKASVNFYYHILGLDTVPEPFHDGRHAWLKTGPATTMHIIQGATEKKEYYKNQHTCFSVASIEAFAESLKSSNMVWEDRDG